MAETQPDPTTPTPDEVKERLEEALFEIRRVIAGQDAMRERVLICLLAGGHLLIEGVPGLAKTLTIKTTAGDTSSLGSFPSSTRRACLRQMLAICRSRLRTPVSRV